MKITGCYAQTELGHGSNVPGLLTTATLDKNTDEFVLNTPEIRAAKYWPGELGKLATHAVVHARLITNEKDHGIQAFFVPIRDTKTLKEFSGIEAGDIGPKYGFNVKDNGYMIMSNYRIPRENMLSGYTEVDKDGNVTQKGDPRMLYSVMLGIRVIILEMAWQHLSKALTISMRYAICRRQFADQEGTTEERQIMNY